MLCNKMEKQIWISNLRVYVCVCVSLYLFSFEFFRFSFILLLILWNNDISILDCRGFLSHAQKHYIQQQQHQQQEKGKNYELTR